MPQRRRAPTRPRARNLCQHFQGLLARCSRGGLGAVMRDHVAQIDNATKVVCSINLDECRRTAEPEATRWDYVLVIGKGSGAGIGLEVHHAVSTEVPRLIEKKKWAANLLRNECKTLVVKRWSWIVPNGQQPFFTRNDPSARSLAQAGIEFPTPRLSI